MRKQGICLALAALLLIVSLPGMALADQLIEGKLQRPEIVFQASYPDNEPLPGISTTTGLPFEGPYLPVAVVIDNAVGAHPHWGLSQADVLYQVPNAGAGATKLMALFADHAPTQAGGVRSARLPFVDVAHQWGAAFAYAGYPDPAQVPLMNVPGRMRGFGMRQDGLSYNLLGNNKVSERISWNISPHNLSVNIAGIQAELQQKGAKFTPRGFLFTDELPMAGVEASFLSVQHRGMRANTQVNAPSTSEFQYDREKNAYFRSTVSGPFVDKHSEDGPIAFANVIVQRTQFRAVEGGYVALPEFGTSGAAEIFTGGRYIAGAWHRASEDARSVFVDAQGKEIALQRGRSFIIITNEITEVSYR